MVLAAHVDRIVVLGLERSGTYMLWRCVTGLMGLARAGDDTYPRLPHQGSDGWPFAEAGTACLVGLGTDPASMVRINSTFGEGRMREEVGTDELFREHRVLWFNDQPSRVAGRTPMALRLCVVRDFRGWLASVKPWYAQFMGQDWAPPAGYVHWWKQYVRQALWESDTLKTMHVVRYEDLVTRKGPTVAAIARTMHLGVDAWDLQLMDIHLSKKGMKSQSPAHVRRGDPLGWRDELSGLERAAVWRDDEAGEMMHFLGYVPRQETYEAQAGLLEKR